MMCASSVCVCKNRYAYKYALANCCAVSGFVFCVLFELSSSHSPACMHDKACRYCAYRSTQNAHTNAYLLQYLHNSVCSNARARATNPRCITIPTCTRYARVRLVRPIPPTCATCANTEICALCVCVLHRHHTRCRAHKSRDCAWCALLSRVVHI